METSPLAVLKPKDYDEPFGAHKGWKLVVTASVTLGLSTLFLFLRLWTRQRITKAVGVDDYLIVVAWVGSIYRC